MESTAQSMLLGAAVLILTMLSLVIAAAVWYARSRREESEISPRSGYVGPVGVDPPSSSR